MAQTTIFHESSTESNIVYGQIYWGKINGFPAWPCMLCYITNDEPDNRCFSRKKKNGNGHYVQYHVQFFGDFKRGWLTESNLKVYIKGELIGKKKKMSDKLKQAISNADLICDQEILEKEKYFSNSAVNSIKPLQKKAG